MESNNYIFLKINMPPIDLIEILILEGKKITIRYQKLQNV